MANLVIFSKQKSANSAGFCKLNIEMYKQNCAFHRFSGKNFNGFNECELWKVSLVCMCSIVRVCNMHETATSRNGALNSWKNCWRFVASWSLQPMETERALHRHKNALLQHIALMFSFVNISENGRKIIHCISSSLQPTELLTQRADPAAQKAWYCAMSAVVIQKTNQSWFVWYRSLLKINVSHTNHVETMSLNMPPAASLTLPLGVVVKWIC